MPALATLPLHIGVAAAPAPADKLQEQLEAAQDEVYRANVLDDLCRKELVRAEKQHMICEYENVLCSSGAVGA